jgi:transposase
LATVRQRRTTRPRDLPYGEERLAVRWLKVQYACREQPCGRKAFTEQVAELPGRVAVAGRRVAQGLAVSVAGDGLLSWPIAQPLRVPHPDGRSLISSAAVGTYIPRRAPRCLDIPTRC